MSQISSSIITPELRASIGRQSPARPLEVLSASDIRRYVDATGDTNRLWLDDQFARAAGYRGRLLPPNLVDRARLSRRATFHPELNRRHRRPRGPRRIRHLYYPGRTSFESRRANRLAPAPYACGFP